MEDKKRRRCTYATVHQKRKLIELMAKHPELVSYKVTQDFNYKDSQKLWRDIASEINAIPGARKTWKLWRKTWHDIRSNYKKKQALSNGDLKITETTLTPAEQEVLGLKTVSPSFEYQDGTEFITMPDENDQLSNEQQSTASLSETEVIDPSVFDFSQQQKRKVKMKNGHKSHHNDCAINCELIAVQEQRKVQIKEDYLSFKKDYLRQKLLLLKEQTEALKSIAKELCN